MKTMLVLFPVIWIGSLDRVKPYRHVFDPPDEVVGNSLDVRNYFYRVKALHDLFPEHT